jgi:hypothetical protein
MNEEAIIIAGFLADPGCSGTEGAWATGGSIVTERQASRSSRSLAPWFQKFDWRRRRLTRGILLDEGRTLCRLHVSMLAAVLSSMAWKLDQTMLGERRRGSDSRAWRDVDTFPGLLQERGGLS